MNIPGTTEPFYPIVKTMPGPSGPERAVKVWALHAKRLPVTAIAEKLGMAPGIVRAEIRSWWAQDMSPASMGAFPKGGPHA